MVGILIHEIKNTSVSKPRITYLPFCSGFSDVAISACSLTLPKRENHYVLSNYIHTPSLSSDSVCSILPTLSNRIYIVIWFKFLTDIFSLYKVPSHETKLLIYCLRHNMTPIGQFAIKSCSLDAVSVEVLRDIHRFSAQAPVLMKVQSVHHSWSSTVMICHQFPIRRIKELIKTNAQI